MDARMSVHDPSFAALLDHFERCTVIIGPDLRVMHFNKLAATSHRLRHGAELVEGAAYFDIVPSDQNKSFLRNFMAALAGRKVSFERREADGGWTEGRMTPFQYGEGAIQGVTYSFISIAERKNAERGAEEGELVMRALEGNDLQAFILLDEKGRLIKWNSRAASMLMRHNAAPQRGAAIRDLVHSEWEQRVGVLLKVVTNGGVVSDEFDMPDTVDGMVEMHIELVRHDNHPLICVWGHDITAQKRAGRSLRDNEANLRAVFDSSLSSYLLIDRQLRILAFNGVADQISRTVYGKPLSRMMSAADVLAVERRPETQAEIDRAFAGEYVVAEKLNIVDGTERWFERHYDPVKGPDGKIDRITFWSIDVTERRKMYVDLRTSEEKFRKLATLLPVGIYQIDAEGRSVLTNNALEQIVGTDREGIVDGSWKEKVHPDDLPELQAEWDRATSVRDSFQMAFRFLRADGEQVHVLESAVPLYTQSGEFNGYVGTVVDLTSQIKATQLEQEKGLAERSLRFRSDFLASMSHEIRTPLNGIMGMAELLSTAVAGDEERSMARNILHSATDLRAIVNEVLELSKLEAGKVRPEAVAFNLREMMAHVVAQHDVEATRKGLKMEVHIEDSCPVEVISDRRRVGQVLGNLLRNAVKFTSTGKVSLHCVLSSPETLLFEVTDTGPGIPEADRSKLFIDFSQLDHTTAQNMEGTGLGLSISRKLVGLLGGTIGVRSTVGKGSTFWFTLHLNAPASPTENKVSDGAKTPSVLQGLRVLLVEDNLINQKAFMVMLRKFGCNVTACSNGREAVNAFAPDRFDIILMDIQMPEMDGIQATSEIRGGHRHVPPIIGLSGNILERDADGRFATGMDDLLLKPVVSHEVERKLLMWASGTASN